MNAKKVMTRFSAQFAITLLLWVWLGQLSGVLLAPAKEKEKPTKSIRGTVFDSKQNVVPGAKVFVKKVKKNITTVLVTDEKGEFAVYWLDPQFDYEVHAEKGNLSSVVKTVSSFLARKDTALSLELTEKSAPGSQAQSEPGKIGMEVSSAAGTKIAGDWYQPEAKPSATWPAVLLLHDFGEDRRVWESFIHGFLLRNKFAALAIDLRGHGASGVRIGSYTPEERQKLIDSKVLVPDLEAVIQWLKAKDTVDSNRLGVAGTGLGASLAFMASGKFDAMRSAVSISPDFKESQALSAGILNFQPHSILYIACQKGSSNELSARQLEKITGFPVRVEIYENSQASGTAILREIRDSSQAVMEWLKNTM